MKRTIKAVALVVAMVMLAAVFAGCGGTGHGEGDTPHTTGLVGEWDWDETGILYYTFNADGTGRMFVLGNIRWSTNNGILSVCVTPGMCGAVSLCSGPQVWSYDLSGNSLTLTAVGAGGGPFHYTRR